MIKAINVISDTNIGGAGRILLGFLESYDREKISLEVFLPPESFLKKEIESRGVPVTEVPGIEDKSFDWGAVSRLRKLFKEKAPDIVHAHATLSARVAAKGLPGVGVIATRHSVFDQPEKMKRFPRKNISGFINNFFADRIIAVSPAARDNIVEIGADERKISVIFNGVAETRRLSPAEKIRARENLGLSPGDFVVAIIARLEAVKGHSYVLEAAEKLQFDPGVKILVAGTGSEEISLREAARRKNLTNVVFTGFVSEIYKIENIMDLQINASYGTEATSLSLLEGMCLGVPAVVSDFGGNPYVIEDGQNGLLFQKRDANALAEKILLLKNDRGLYARLSQGARERFEKQFTARAMAKGIEEEYENLQKKISSRRGENEWKKRKQ